MSTPSISMTENERLKRDEGRRRAALHFAEDFVIGLKPEAGHVYYTNVRALQRNAEKNLGEILSETQLTGLVVFFRSGPLCKDNQYMFKLASFVCDLLDDRMDIKG